MSSLKRPSNHCWMSLSRKGFQMPLNEAKRALWNFFLNIFPKFDSFTSKRPNNLLLKCQNITRSYTQTTQQTKGFKLNTKNCQQEALVALKQLKIYKIKDSSTIKKRRGTQKVSKFREFIESNEFISLKLDHLVQNELELKNRQKMALSLTIWLFLNSFLALAASVLNGRALNQQIHIL